MAKYIQIPGMGVVEFPDNMTDEQISSVVKKQLLINKINSPQSDQQEKRSWLDEVKGGLASAPINLYLGGKQLLTGGLSPQEQEILQMNKEAERRAPVSSFVSNAATISPVALIPGANTVAGAALTGAGTGLLQPVEGDQSLNNIAKGKLISGGTGAVLGGIGQIAANKAASYLSNRLREKATEAAQQKSLNAMRDQVLSKSREAGYIVPNSEVAPNMLTNMLESIGGKAATKQQATAANQEITNKLASRALGLPEDQPISTGVLEVYRKNAAWPYGEIAAISNTANKDLEALKQARNDATGWFNAYNRSASPADLAKAKEARALADTLESNLEGYAQEANKQDLIPALRQARQDIAKSYTVERALNPSTGEISAPVIGRMFEKGTPLTDELQTIGQFRNAFPKFSGEGAKTPNSSISGTDAISGALLGTLGAGLTGNPLGAAAAALPLGRIPARSLALSEMLQRNPSYSPDLATVAAANALSPEAAALLSKALMSYGNPSVADLAGQ